MRHMYVLTKFCLHISRDISKSENIFTQHVDDAPTAHKHMDVLACMI